MRTAVAAACLAMLLSACLADEPAPLPRLCVGDGGGDANQPYALLVARDAPEELRPTGERALYQVNVLPGQGLSIEAHWTSQAGIAQLIVDGRALNNGTGSGDYVWQGPVDAGIHEVELAGAPVAFGVEVDLALLATGCPA